MTSPSLDYEDIPDSSRLIPPTAEELPIAVLAVQHATRSIRHDVAAVRSEINVTKTWVVRLVIAVLAGSGTVAVTVVGAAMTVGSERARVEHHEAELRRIDERVRDLEVKAMGGGER